MREERPADLPPPARALISKRGNSFSIHFAKQSLPITETISERCDGNGSARESRYKGSRLYDFLKSPPARSRRGFPPGSTAILSPTIALNIAHRPANNPGYLSNFLPRFFLDDTDKSPGNLYLFLSLSPFRAGLKSWYDFEVL
jgi:hypothetical protein